MIIKPEPLTKAAFLPFGDVLETDGITPQLINSGHTQKFGGLAEITILDDGFGQLGIYRSSAIELPFEIKTMERHPSGSQAFFPLHERPFPVVVAASATAPVAGDIKVFLTNGRQGVNIHAGVWHHYQLTLGQDSEYIVVDRGGAGKNCDEHRLEQELLLHI